MPSFSGGCTTNTKKTAKFFTICKQTHGKSAGMFFVLMKISVTFFCYQICIGCVDWPLTNARCVYLFRCNSNRKSLTLCIGRLGKLLRLNSQQSHAKIIIQLSCLWETTIYAMISISSKISHSHCYKNKMLSECCVLYINNMSIHIPYTFSMRILYVDRVVGIQQTHNSYSIIESTVVYLLCIKLFKWFIRLIIYFLRFFI